MTLITTSMLPPDVTTPRPRAADLPARGESIDVAIGGTDVESIQHAIEARIADRVGGARNRDTCAPLRKGGRVEPVERAGGRANVEATDAIIDRSAADPGTAATELRRGIERVGGR